MKKSIELNLFYQPVGFCIIDHVNRQLADNPSLKLDVAHGCNTIGDFGAGVAGSISRKCPSVRNAYLESLSSHKSVTDSGKLGDFSYFPQWGDRGSVFNFMTQLHPGSGTLSYKAITESFLKYLESTELREGVRHLIIPEIGCGIAGGDRECVLIAILAALQLFEGDFGSLESIQMYIWNKGPKSISDLNKSVVFNKDMMIYYKGNVLASHYGIQESRIFEHQVKNHPQYGGAR